MEEILPMFMKYPKIRTFGAPENRDVLKHEVEVTEKLDGANVSVRKHEGELLLASRNLYLLHNPDKAWGNFIGWVESKDWSALPDGYIVYMEFMRKHTLHYTDLPDLCIGLDVFVVGENKFLGTDERHELLEKLDIIPVPILFKGKAESFSELQKFIRKSNYSTIDMEGIVIKNYTQQWDLEYGTNRNCAKIVRDEFKEKMRVAMAKPNVVEEIVNTFTTDARMIKGIDRLKEDGLFTGGLRDLAHLPKFVMNDIMEEEETEIKEMLFKNFQKDIRRGVVRKVIPFYKEWVMKQGDLK